MHQNILQNKNSIKMKKIYIILLAMLALSLTHLSVSAKISDGDRQALEGLYDGTNGPNWTNPWPWDPVTKKFTADPVDNPELFPGLVVKKTTGYVTEIHLSNNNLVGSIPEDFNIAEGVSALEYVKVIDISQNPGLSGAVPSEFISFMVRLDTLKMAQVRLTGPLPDNINEMVELNYMDISFTGIDHIPATIGGITQLSYLNLSENLMTTIPVEIYNLSALNILNLSNNQINEIPALPNGVSGASSGVVLKVANNRLDFCDLENLKAGFPNANITVGKQSLSSNINPIIKNIPFEGTTILDANVCGNGNTYQWKVSITNSPYVWTNIEGATNSQLQLTVTSTKYYRCDVNNPVNPSLTIYSRIYKVVVGADLAPDVTFYYNEDQVGELTNFPNYDTKLKIKAEDPNYTITFNSSKVVPTGSPVKYFYHPTPNFFGDDIIEYTVTAKGNNYLGYLTMTLAPVDDAPVLTITPPANALMEEGKYVVTFGDSLTFLFTYNDDIDMGRSCYNYSFPLPSSTNWVNNIIKDGNLKSGKIICKPKANPDGISDKLIRFQAKEGCTEGRELSSNLTTFTARVKNKPVNNPPVVSNQTFNMYPNPASLLSKSFTVSDETPYNSLIFNVTQPANGTVTVSANLFTYIPKKDFTGTDEINYTVSDGENPAVAGKVTINVTYPAALGSIPEQVFSNLTQNSVVTTYPKSNFGFTTDASFYYPQELAAMLNYTPLTFWNIILGYTISLKPEFNIASVPTFLIPTINEFIDSVGTWTYKYKGSQYLIGTQNIKLELAIPPATAPDKYEQLNAQATAASTISVANDTVEVVYGESIDLVFPAINYLTGQLQMQLVGQPTKGTLNEFVFASYTATIFTNYKGSYTPKTNADVYDVITYLVSNGLETKTATKTIHIRPVKKAPSIAIIGNKQILEDDLLTLAIPVTDEDNENNELSMEAEITPIIEGFIAEVNNGVLTVIPPENFNGEVFVKITVTDPDQQSDNQLFVLQITPVNDPPSLYVPKKSYTIDYNTPLNVEISASDIDENDNLSLSFTGLPAWLTPDFKDESYVVLTGTPADTDAGMFTIGVKANDGTEMISSSFAVKVNGPIPDNPPVVLNALDDIELPKKSAPYTIDLNSIFNDADSDPMQFSILDNNNSNWISATLSGSIVTLTIVDADFTGYSNIRVQAESKGINASTTINIFTPDNAPITGDALPQIVGWKNDADYLVDLTAAFSDPDGDELTYHVESVQHPDVITVTIEGTKARVHFNEGKGGTTEVYISASAYGKSASNGFIVSIKDAAPVLKQGVANQSLFKNDQPLSIDLSNLFTDSDDATVDLSVLSISNGNILTAQITNNTLVITPKGNADGVSDITILGKSGTYTIEYTFQVTVNDLIPVVDQAPGDQLVPKNSAAFELDLSKLFKDEDDPYVSLSIKSVVDQSLFTYSLYGYKLTITPIAGKSGSTNITITGTASGKSVDYTFKVTLDDKAPKVNVAISDKTVLKNSADLSINLSTLFIDEDDSDMTLSIKSVSNQSLLTATISGTTLTVKIKAGIAGVCNITIQGTSGGKTVDDTFTVTVNDQAPIATAIPAVKAEENDAPFEIELGTYFSDPDGDALTYTVTANSKTSLIGTSISGSKLTIEFKANQFGTAELEITATADTKTVKATISITVDEKVSVNELLSNDNIEVFPNPVDNHISLKWTGENSLGFINYSISDVMGRIILEQTISSVQPGKAQHIDLTRLSKGAYFMHLTIESRIYSYRFIKE